MSDVEILPLVEATIDQKNPREWYWALMILTSSLKREFENPCQEKRPLYKTTRSGRRIRGLVIKKLLNDGSLSTDTLSKAAGVSIDRLKDILKDLTDEGFLRQENGLFMIA